MLPKLLHHQKAHPPQHELQLLKAASLDSLRIAYLGKGSSLQISCYGVVSLVSFRRFLQLVSCIYFLNAIEPPLQERMFQLGGNNHTRSHLFL